MKERERELAREKTEYARALRLQQQQTAAIAAKSAAFAAAETAAAAADFPKVSLHFFASRS